MTIATILIIAAVILFVLDAAGVSSRINLQSAGLACFAASFLAGAI